MEIIRASETWHIAAVHYLRIQTAIDLNISLAAEIDETADAPCDYLLIIEENTPVAAGRLRSYPEYAKFERICVAPAYQSRGIGSLLIREMEKWASERGFPRILITSKWDVRQFYLQLGYQPEGDIIADGLFPLIRVTKTLA